MPGKNDYKIVTNSDGMKEKKTEETDARYSERIT